jgi:hypothetical protein
MNNILQYNEYIFVIENFLSEAECKELIALSETQPYEAAKVNLNGRQTLVTGVRNNQRLMVENHEWARFFFEKARYCLPQVIGHSALLGFNELFRFYKYTPGQQFRRHRDGSFVRNEKEASYYTFMVYLNDDFTGGETGFDEYISIQPQTGNALVFLHPLHHEGKPVLEGTKYVLRTDVMYRLIE